MCGLCVWVTCECMWRGEPDSWPLYIMHLPEVSQGQASCYILLHLAFMKLMNQCKCAVFKEMNIHTWKTKMIKTKMCFGLFIFSMTIVDWLHSITVKIVNIIIRFTGFSGLHQSIMGEITLQKLSWPIDLSRSGHTWSFTIPLLTGVPKGCVLSPLLYSLITNNCRPVHGFQISCWTWTWHLHLKGPLLVHQGLQPGQKPQRRLFFLRTLIQQVTETQLPTNEKVQRKHYLCQLAASLKFALTLIHSLPSCRGFWSLQTRTRTRTRAISLLNP